MSTAEQREQQELKQHKRERMDAFIGEQIIHTLGKPTDLLKVQIKRLWENCYRVNVLTGKDVSCPTIANSYFVEADSEGKIVESNPKIVKQY